MTTPDFRGLRVLSLESRRAAEMAKLITHLGGEAVSAPALREAGLENAGEVKEFLGRLDRGEFDWIIFLTGVGLRRTLEQAAPENSPARLADALRRIRVLARGPKPAAELRKLGVEPTLVAPEPHTWREVIASLDAAVPAWPGLRVGVQEYGQPADELLRELERRGARIHTLRLYSYQLPEDLEPLRAAIAEIMAGTIAVILSHHKVIIIGTGPAGYTAAVYLSRANFVPLVFDGLQPGGQLTTTTMVDNFPGFPNGIDGLTLMNNMREQALRFQSIIKSEVIIKVDLSKRPYCVISDCNSYSCDALIIATGASAKWLGIGKDEQLSHIGGGVSACATCDGFFFKDKEVAVIGGGDTAIEEAIYLTNFASKVTLIHRRDQLRASKIMQERAMKNKKISFKWNSVITDIHTKDKTLPDGELRSVIQSITLKNVTTGIESQFFLDGLFVAIGHTPNTSLFTNQLPMNDDGYLLVEPKSSRTILPGVFACGDVQDSIYRQAVTAAGSGCMAAIDAIDWLS